MRFDFLERDAEWVELLANAQRETDSALEVQSSPCGAVEALQQGVKLKAGMTRGHKLVLSVLLAEGRIVQEYEATRLPANPKRPNNID